MTYYDLNMNSKRITNTQDPSANQDVATKNYVDTGNQTPIYYPNLRRAGRANGPIATNFDAAYASTGLSGGISSSLSQYPLFYALYLKAGTLISNVFFSTGNTASGLWGRTVGLYRKDGVRLAMSNDTTSSSITNTIYTMAFTTPYTIPSNDFYYAAVNIYNTGGGSVTFVTTPGGAAFSTGSAIDSRAPFFNYPQITTNATGNLSLFRSATTTSFVNTPGSYLPADIAAAGLTLKPLGLQLWIGVS